MKQLSAFLLAAFSTSISFAQSCPPNIGFDNGDFSSWQCLVGQTTANTSCSTRTSSFTASAPIPARHTIIQPNSQMDPFGNFPITPENSPIARLGLNGTLMEEESIHYTFSVPSNSSEFSLNFRYALVYQAPSHCEKSNPYFGAKIFDVTTGQYISCLSGEFYPTPGSNGYQLSTNTSQGTVYYKPWTDVTLPLTEFAGHTLRLEFINADCAQGGHWAYAYLDLSSSCGSSITGNKFCPGSNPILKGPAGYASYAWWNSNFTQKIDTTRNLTLTQAPTGPTVYALDLISPLGSACRDTLYVTVQPNATVPAHSGPDQLLCGSSTPVTIGSAGQTGYSYNWTPTTGLNNAAIAQPSALPAATTHYVLTVTDNSTGCSKKDTVSVYVNAVPAIFQVNATTQCLAGNNFQFSVSNPLPGSTYLWSFGNGSTSLLQTPSVSYASGGNYVVKLKVTTSAGCVDSSAQTVTVGALSAPVASITGGVLQSSFTSGNQWYLNGVAITGATGQSYTPTASGTYTVIVTINGCSSAVSNSVNMIMTSIRPMAEVVNIRIAPNPVHGDLTISYSGNHKMNLEIVDLGGRVLHSRRAIPSNYSVDFSRYSKGAYIIWLRDVKNNAAFRQMVVKP